MTLAVGFAAVTVQRKLTLSPSNAVTGDVMLISGLTTKSNTKLNYN